MMRTGRFFGQLTGLLAVTVLAGFSVIPAVAVHAQSGLTAPVAVSMPQPDALFNRSGEQIAGWAIVRYSVAEDGSTHDIAVADVVPPFADAGPVIDAVGQWTFEPAMNQGEAIDWFNLESVLVFDGSEGAEGVSEAFTGRYEAIQDLLEAEAYAGALDAGEMLLNDSQSHMELGLALAQQAVAKLGLADLHGALDRFRLATDPRIPALPAPELLSALQLRFQIETQLGRTLDALDTFDRIDHAVGPDAVNPFDSMAFRLADEWGTVEAIPVQGQVDDHPWRIRAGRRTFTVADVTGTINGIDVYCDRRMTRLDYQPDAEWSLPNSWQNCELFVDGEPGTRFVYYGFMDPAEQD